MKKILGILLSTLLTLSLLASCGSKTTSETNTNTNNTSNNTTTTSAKYNDGTYTAYSDATPESKGYAYAEVTIKEDKITEVKLYEVNELGKLKDYANYPMKEAKTANEEMAKRFVEKNSADVDTFTGVTNSSEKYKQAVARALEMASKEKDAKKYLNGTFLASSDQNAKQGYALAYVTIQDDKITKVVLQEVGEDGKIKDYSTYPLKEAKTANEEMAKRFVEKNSADVDTFTGVTNSSEKYKEAVKKALEMATK
ncbi:FMN-binding domain protein [Caloramator mitchellensis]|uniref:FMN-binding domain protein n=1 Tax=Caloramator mitchellensis TaxID=908809 RepID=A0A0R3JTC4_CALMK|nr:FMN-binding protein [Caloramator mitchellensis]KRQ86728.1 FMN-binding domain protein [Caloramator mitchellensis]